MNTFRKAGNEWAIAIPERGEPGQTVTVTLRSGATKQATLGDFIQSVTVEESGQNVVRYFYHERKASPTGQAVGDLRGILNLFDKAKQHLKYPAIVLGVPGVPDPIRISRAGDKAKLPGTLNVTSAVKDDSKYGRAWYGRVKLDGTYEPSATANAEAVTKRLREFAADPVKVAGEHGRLTGHCCFCNLPLSDERSTAVGYGKKCAENFGLRWGTRPAEIGERAA